MEETNSFSSVQPTPSSSPRRWFFIGAAVFVAVIVLIVGGIGIYRVYAKQGSDGFTIGVAKVLRLPVIKVNGTGVPYAEYVEDLKAIHTLQAYDRANGGEAAEFTETEMSDQVLWRLVNAVLLKESARQHGVSVEKSDVQALRDKILESFKTPEDADRELTERYGWNLQVYEAKVIRPAILQQKLTQIVESDPEFRAAVRAEAAAVLERVKKGEDFAALAEKYGSDGTAQRGGELGWFKRGEMVAEFENAAFKLKKGELSPTLVETAYGFHIIKVDDKKTDKTKDAKGKSIEEEQVKASHILFAPTVAKYMDAFARRSNIHLYINVHNPFEELQSS